MDCTRATILLIEDDHLTRTFLAENLGADGYAVSEATTLAQARQRLEQDYPDLTILDLGLPDGDGLQLLSAIRESSFPLSPIDPDLPVVVLSGRAGELERLRGFAHGCDDYVTKPFGYPELRARIAAVLRRAERRASSTARLRIGPLEIDAVARKAWVGDEPVALSNKEFALLLVLASDPLRVFTREELLRTVWGYLTIGTTRTLDSHASRLRRKLAVGGASFVVNVWGVGYRLI